MNKIEYDYNTIETVIKIIDSLTISGIENIKKMNLIIELLDSGKENKKEEEK